MANYVIIAEYACGCKILEGDPPWWGPCPLHDAAPDLLEALLGFGVFGGGEYCFCQDEDTSAHSERCVIARLALSKAGVNDE